MISEGHMVYVFLLIMEDRVYIYNINVTLKLSSISCHITMSCTDIQHWPDYNQVSVCHTGVILVIILITLILVTV